MSNTKRTIKVVLVGDVVGKTSLIEAFMNNPFLQHTLPTVFKDYETTVSLGHTDFILKLHDTSGQEDYDRLRPLGYPMTDVFLVFYSVVIPYTMVNLKEKWVPEILHHCPKTPFILIGTQIDLRDNKEVLARLDKQNLTPISYEQGVQLAKEVKAEKYIECSAFSKFQAEGENRLNKSTAEAKPRQENFNYLLRCNRSSTKRTLKIVLVGDAVVGKTCLIEALVNNIFLQDPDPTVYDEYETTLSLGQTDYTLKLRDTSGAENYQLRALAYRLTDVILVCYSVENPTSFENVKNKWGPEILSHCPETPFILVGTKTDLRDNEEDLEPPISYEQGVQFAKEIKAVKYVECSAFSRFGVRGVFEEAIIAAISPQGQKIKQFCWVL